MKAPVTRSAMKASNRPSMSNTTRATLAFAAVLGVGCAPAAVETAPPVPAAEVAAPDRSERPDPGPVADLRLPEVQRFTLSNGLEVYLLEKHDVPLVQMNLTVGAGSVDDPAELLGLASLTATMMDEGAAGRSALEIADAFEFLGARFFIAPGSHATRIGLRVPTARLDEGLQVFSDVVMRPDFPGEELERLRAERITSLVRRHDDPQAVAGVLFDRRVFGPDHPYGRTVVGEEAHLRAMTTDDLRRFHATHFRPNNASVVVVGAISPDEARSRLEAALGGWEPGEVPTASVAEPGPIEGRTIYLVDVPGAAQSVIRLGHLGVPRSTEDYYALEVMNTILGGSFTSRLNRNLREDKGYTYGARSGFDMWVNPGPFWAGAAVQTDVTGPALTEFMNELRRIHEPMPEEEVSLARNFLAMRYPAGFQSVSEIAGRVGGLVGHGLPVDELDAYTARVLEVSGADVERAARRYVDPDNMAIVVVGDRAVVEEQIRAQGIADVEILEVTDVLGAVPAVTGPGT